MIDRRIARRIILIAALIAFTMAIGTIGFRLLEGYPLFDAFYMTLITITTVGYQEIRPLSHAGRVFNSFLILFGVSAMFVAVGAMTQTIIELQLQDRYGERRRRRAIMHMKDHFIVCGFGRVGRNAAFELQRAGVPFLVLDRNEQRVERATAAGMAAMRADATQDESLREAGVERARGFIAALATDADNVFVILSVKTLNPAPYSGDAGVGRKRRRKTAQGRRRHGVLALQHCRTQTRSGAGPAARRAVARFRGAGGRARRDDGTVARGAGLGSGIAAAGRSWRRASRG